MTLAEIEADYLAAVNRVRIDAVARYLVEVLGAKLRECLAGAPQSLRINGTPVQATQP